MSSESSTLANNTPSHSVRRRRLAVTGMLLCAAVGAMFLMLPTKPDIVRASRYIDMGQFGLAGNELGRILEDDPDHHAALLMKGDLLRSKEDFAGAVSFYRRVPIDAAEFRLASLGHIHALLASFDLAEAEHQMQRHLETFPDERSIWDELRWLCFNQFRTRDVEELSHWWLKNHPKDIQALNHLLLGTFRPQVPQEGTPYLEQALVIGDAQASVLRALAWAAWQSGKQDEATRLLEQAWQANSDDPRTRLLSAEFLIEQQNIVAADRVLGAEPFGVSGEMFGGQLDRWYWLRSRVLLEQKDIAASLHQVEQALELDISNLSYIHEHAVLLKQLEREAEAAAAFKKARTIEQCKKRFAEIAFSGAWENPTPELRQEISELYELCGNELTAKLWRQ